MSLLTIFIVFIVAGVIVFLVRKAPFIDADWKNYISYGVLLVVVLWLLSIFFNLGSIGQQRVGK